MPDATGSISPPVSDFMRAAERVGAWLSSLGAEVAPLTFKDLERYPDRGFAGGWRVTVEAGGDAHRLDLLLPHGFPWQPPRAAMVDPPPFLTWPHVEIDALLCLAPNTQSTDPDDPVGVVAVTLQSARDLLTHLINDDFQAEFRDEFLTYWSFAAHGKGPAVVSLVTPAPPTRIVYVWRGAHGYVLGESEAQLSAWLTNHTGTKADPKECEPAPFLWVGAPFVPSEYPKRGFDLLQLAVKTHATTLLSDVARENPAKIVSLMGFQTGDGPALAAAVVTPPVAQEHGARDPLVKGFRPGMVPDDVLMSRYFGGGKLMRRPVERADAAWIHGRGQDARAAELQKARVTLLGCGSVGAPMAIAIAQAGIGALSLVDFDVLNWANVGRHPLGASAVGINKAKALAQRLRSDFPHLTVEHHEVDVDTMIRLHGRVLESGDLIISATGSWAADARLEAWRTLSGHHVPVVYAWTEAYACAGHAVLVGPSGGCLRCGFDRTGLPQFQATTWPNESLFSEPACGALYQPYGPVELGFVIATAGELALSAVLGAVTAPTHRIWIAPSDRVKHLGGEWSSAWQADPSFRQDGGFQLDRPWPKASCPRCKEALAA